MKYINYFIYIIIHKYYVFIECCKNRLCWRGLVHDLSKFRPSEFIPYAKYFYGGKKNKKEFNLAWALHYKRNKHHWNHWVLQDGVADPMPKKYVLEMICDWKAMARKSGDSWWEYYELNKHKFTLNLMTRFLIQEEMEIDNVTRHS